MLVPYKGYDVLRAIPHGTRLSALSMSILLIFYIKFPDHAGRERERYFNSAVEISNWPFLTVGNIQWYIFKFLRIGFTIEYRCCWNMGFYLKRYRWLSASISISNALEFLQSCIRLSICNEIYLCRNVHCRTIVWHAVMRWKATGEVICCLTARFLNQIGNVIILNIIP